MPPNNSRPAIIPTCNAEYVISHIYYAPFRFTYINKKTFFII